MNSAADCVPIVFICGGELQAGEGRHSLHHITCLGITAGDPGPGPLSHAFGNNGGRGARAAFSWIENWIASAIFELSAMKKQRKQETQKDVLHELDRSTAFQWAFPLTAEERKKMKPKT